jgi:hypothetical protein
MFRDVGNGKGESDDRSVGMRLRVLSEWMDA